MMLFYDTLLHNGDRHNQNVGILRDSGTGKITGLAPSERDKIVNAVMYASEETRKAFELPNFNYSLLEDYITDTYDYFVSQKQRIQQNK